MHERDAARLRRDVHVQRGGALAKFWLRPVSCAHARGFKPHELAWIARIVEAHQGRLLGAWHAFFAF